MEVFAILKKTEVELFRILVLYFGEYFILKRPLFMK